MANDRKLVVSVVLIGTAAVLALSLVDGINKAVLAPLAALIVGGISALSALYVDARRREDEERRRIAARDDEDKRRAEQRRDEQELAAKAIRERARWVAIPLQEQFRDVATSLLQGRWPDLGRAEVDLAADRQDALVERLGEKWLLIAWGLQSLREVGARSQDATSRRIDEFDRGLARTDAQTLLMAAEALDEATWDEDRVEQDRRNTREIADEIMKKIEAEMANSEPSKDA